MDDIMKKPFIDLKGRGRAEGTIENYRKNVAKFLYIGKARNWSPQTRSDNIKLR